MEKKRPWVRDLIISFLLLNALVQAGKDIWDNGYEVGFIIGYEQGLQYGPHPWKANAIDPD